MKAAISLDTVGLPAGFRLFPSNPNPYQGEEINMSNSKTWTHVPGTSVANLNLTYVMGSYTATATYAVRWDHKGNLVNMVDGYRVTGPGFTSHSCYKVGLAEARLRVRSMLRVRCDRPLTCMGA